MTLPLDTTPFFTGEELTYAASGLPVGLSIDPSTGIVSGAPTVEGASSVTVTATNGAGQAGQSFTWTIVPGAGGGALTAETGAVGHWVFGTDYAGMTDLVSAQPMTEQIAGSTSLTANSVVISDGDGTASQAQRGLTAPQLPHVDQTLCAVVSTGGAGTRIVLGNLSTTDGAGIFFFNGDLFGNARDLPFSNTNFDPSTPTTAPYVFVAMSLSASNDWVLFRGDPAGPVTATGSPLSAPVPNTNAVGIGNTTYNSASFSGGGSYAEFVVFNASKTTAEIEAIYQRSKARLSGRGISVL